MSGLIYLVFIWPLAIGLTLLFLALSAVLAHAIQKGVPRNETLSLVSVSLPVVLNGLFVMMVMSSKDAMSAPGQLAQWSLAPSICAGLLCMTLGAKQGRSSKR